MWLEKDAVSLLPTDFFQVDNRIPIRHPTLYSLGGRGDSLYLVVDDGEPHEAVVFAMAALPLTLHHCTGGTVAIFHSANLPICHFAVQLVEDALVTMVRGWCLFPS